MTAQAISNLQVALDLASLGFAVIPCHPNKTPCIKGWPDQAGIDETTIRNWWTRFPGAIPGLPTGTNRLLVVDCDLKNGVDGIAAWDGLCANAQFDQTQCFAVETPSKGRHIYFHQNVEPLLGNTTGTLAPGIDTRGKGGYVVAPGAMLPDGRQYRPICGSLQSIGPLPGGLRDHLMSLASGSGRANLQYASAVLRDELAKVKIAHISARNDTLNRAAFLVGTVLHLGLNERDVRRQLGEAALVVGLELPEIGATIESAITAGKGQPRVPQVVNVGSAENANHDEAIIRCVADVVARPVRWLWRNRIAIGKLTLIAGDPGLGKSQLTMFLAARVTTGTPWPNDDGRPLDGSVVLLSCEDDIADTIRPRLEAAGANISRVQVIEAIRSSRGLVRGFSLQEDMQHIESLIDRMNDVALVIVDPITAYLGKADSHKTADVRAVLAPLQELASRKSVAIVAVSHLNKSVGGGKSINAVTGSGAFVAAARAAFLVVKDKSDLEKVLLIEMKNNIGKASSLAFRILRHLLPSQIATSMVQFDPGTVTITADEAIAFGSDDGQVSALEEAVEFLKIQFVDGPVRSVELFNRAEHAGIAKKTLRRAAKKIGILTQKDGFQGEWFWNWPAANLGATIDPNMAKDIGTVVGGTFDAWAPLTREMPIER